MSKFFKSSWFSASILLAAFTGILISGTAFQITNKNEHNRVVAEFNEIADKKATALQHEISVINLSELNAIRSFYRSVPNINREAFQKFTLDTLEQYPAIQALEWIPRVPLSKRNIFEENARSDGLADFNIREKLNNVMSIAGQKSEYYPVYFVEPIEDNRKALGFDLSSNPTRVKSLLKSRDSGEMIATPRITLVQEPGNHSGFLVFLPVYHGNPTSVEERREQIIGFILGVFRVSQIIKNFSKSPNIEDVSEIPIDIHLYDITNLDDVHLLYPSSASKQYGQQETREKTISLFAEREISVADRTWKIEFIPTDEYLLKENISFDSWLILALGLIFTFLVTLKMKSSANQHSIIEAEVKRQTIELLESEKRGRDSDRKLDLIYRNVHAGITIQDASGPILHVNDLACEILTMTRDQMLGKTSEDPVWRMTLEDGSPVLGHQHPSMITIQTGKPVYNAVRALVFPEPYGIKWISISTEPIFDENSKQVIEVLSTFHDITDRKNKEKELLKARADADAANRAKSDFLANMSHEIRTPMNAIIGLNHLALSKPMPPDQLKYQEKIGTAAKSLLRLINDILDFSKIEAGKLDIVHEDFLIEKVLQDLHSIVDVKCQEKGLTFSVNMSEPIPPLNGDSLRLGQVLTNLTSNAIKFTELGEVSLVVGVEKESNEEIEIRFVVSDTGIGMNQEQVDKLFQPFHQADSTITRKYGGTGLGLIISKRLVELMGGEIQVKSEFGEGSHFIFTARFRKSTNELHQCTEKITENQASELLAGVHLLLVEDNEINQQVAQELLEKIGVEVTIANNGKESVEIVADKKFDGVLMDLQMPVMDGLKASREIRKNSDHSILPIIAMTANAMTGDREKCLNAGMQDHISKPINPEVLYETLVQWIKPESIKLLSQKSKSNSDPKPTEKHIDFPVLYGIDNKAGLKYVGNNRLIYRNVLGKFANNQGDACQRMKLQLQSGDTNSLELTAHTLKSVSSTIGAKGLADLAGKIEICAKSQTDQNDLASFVDETETELSKIVIAIEAMMTAEETATILPNQEKNNVEADVLRPMFQKAVDKLIAFDASIEDVVAEIEPLVSSEKRMKKLKLIQDSIEYYDMETCLNLFREWARDEKIELES
ncbi:MAG: CHASE domain-containing protein [Magnetococcales bacterium]|nr:CHASE domain-containing protein [Magnetococcales bacterium]